MTSIEKLENKLAVLRKNLEYCTDPDDKASLEEQIDYLQDDIDTLETEEREAADWEEMTGTTKQDLYLERNSYAIRQSEMIDRFRAEI